MKQAKKEAFSPAISICIFAWNESAVIGRAIRSLFAQTLFAEAAREGQQLEVLCVVNGSTDATVEVAESAFAELREVHPHGGSFQARVVNLVERGKINAWNQFVHRLAHPDARALIMMDADIVIHRRESLWSMYQLVNTDPGVSIAVDRPCKDIEFKARKNLRDQLSLAAGRATTSAGAQLCGQLYCIRAEVARNIYLPRDLAACEDGFLKWVVCTDFFSRSALPERIRTAPDAEHTFEAYTSLRDIFKNQQRQVIGQTIVHVLVDKHLRTLPAPSRRRLAETLKAAEAADPDWLKLRIGEHVRNTSFCWRLYPGLATHRLKALARLPLAQLFANLPAALAGSCMTLAASFPAFIKLKQGCTNYWPKANRCLVSAPRVLQATDKTS